MGCATAHFLGGPGEGPKGQILFNNMKFQLQSQFQRFLNQTLCVYSQMKDKTYQTVFSLDRLGHTPWVGLGGTVGGLGGGGQKYFFPKFNQSWCVIYLHEGHMQRHNFLGPGPPGALGRGKKFKYHKISITKSISNIFKPNFICLLTNERYKTY